jgi:Protein of unknown function (DUF2721)
MPLFADLGISNDAARAIQLALAPTFLLTSIAGILNVLSGRLGRIVDRGRFLSESPQSASTLPAFARANELQVLERRRGLVGFAITACTLSALLVCLVIVMLFMEVLLELPLKWFEGVLFTCATVALVIGLSYFLREVHYTTWTARVNFNPVELDAKEESPTT